MDNNLHTALFLANLLYGVEIDDLEFEEIALICHRLIGNKLYKLYHYTAMPLNQLIELPCNCDLIEAVTYAWEDWGTTSNKHNFGDLNSSYIEEYTEGGKIFTDLLYSSGKFVKYRKIGKTLYLNEPYGGPIHILYKGEVLDENDLPYINDKEVMAIATYVAYVTTYKEGLLTKNIGIINLAQDLKNKANVYIDEARTPEYINQNEMNEILDIKTSWNRKSHGRSYKPLM